MSRIIAKGASVSSALGKRRRVIIIGGGASGVLLVCHLFRDPSCDLDVVVMEKRPEVGRGIAYYTANPDHLLNVRAANMSAFPDQPDHFWRWLGARQGSGTGRWQACADPFCFAPRQIYGDYIASLLAPLFGDGERPGRISVIRGECVSIMRSGADFTVTLADGSIHHSDLVVLATGHEPSTIQSGFDVDPWVAPAEAGVKPTDCVLILGTGLTMVDYVLSLLLAGHRGEIIALSRHGLLPRAHRPVQPLTIDRSTIPFRSNTAALLHWLRRLIDDHSACGGDWRSVIDSIRPFTQEIWQQLPLSARRSFLQHARAWWDVHRHRMAPEVEKRVDGAVASGQLTVRAAKLCSTEPHPPGVSVRYRRRGQRAIETLFADKIVDCRSIGATPLKVTNPALRSLFAQGLARLDELRIGIDVTRECAVIDRSGIPSDRLFAVGPLTRAAFWEIVAVPDIRNQCVALARRITHGHLGDPSKSPAATYPST